MATDITPAPANSISAAIPINGEVGPPVSGRLPPAALAAEALAVPLAVAVAVEVVLAEVVAIGVAGAEALALE